jgi:hypothetical protein
VGHAVSAVLSAVTWTAGHRQHREGLGGIGETNCAVGPALCHFSPGVTSPIVFIWSCVGVDVQRDLALFVFIGLVMDRESRRLRVHQSGEGVLASVAEEGCGVLL